MKIETTAVSGVLIIRVNRQRDKRGGFARYFDAAWFRDHGLCHAFWQYAVAWNSERATLRGLHYQDEPYAETKVVRCARGAVFDVAVDLRAGSDTYGRHVAVELHEDDDRMMYIPAGVAHGYLTLDDETELDYLISAPYMPDYARGIRWDSPALGIRWPLEPKVISERDRAWPEWTP